MEPNLLFITGGRILQYDCLHNPTGTQSRTVHGSQDTVFGKERSRYLSGTKSALYDTMQLYYLCNPFGAQS